ncbi:hypothetical protein CRUP_015588 [Coryphaenoides rupestris]|nr:hypothetical protein CRUP_015588 [Coryphaenoides rupestris]
MLGMASSLLLSGPEASPSAHSAPPAPPTPLSPTPPPPAPHSLSSPGGRHPWAQTGDLAGAAEEDEEPATVLSPRDPEHHHHHQGSITYHTKNVDFPSALDDLAHYELLAQLRTASDAAADNNNAIQNGVRGGSIYQHQHHHRQQQQQQQQPGSRHEELPPAIWTYLQGPALRQHVRSCQERHAEHMVCPLCGYTATYRAQMEQHLALHNQVQDKNCIISEQGTETRKFKCQQCGKAFKYKHHLKEHLRIHSGEKPYECSNCKKRFSHSGSYSSHLSSKKCLSGGGGGGNMAEVAGIFNGHGKTSLYLPNHHHHHQHHHHHSFPMSPPIGGERNSNGKHSPFSPSGSDAVTILDSQHQQLSPQDGLQKPFPFPRGPGLSGLWDPAAELSLRAKGTTLLPYYLQSGAKFEQVLQQMLHSRAPEGKRPRVELEEEEQEQVEAEEEEEVVRMEQKVRVMENGGRAEQQTSGSPEGRVRRGSGRGVDGERATGVAGVACRWCSQLFPSAAVLLQHERYLCKATREAGGGPTAHQSPRGKPHSSPPLPPPLHFLRVAFPAGDYSQASRPFDGHSLETSSPRRLKPLPPHWHLAPPQQQQQQQQQQQLLFAMQSSPTHRPRPDRAMSAYAYWPGQGGGSPGQPISPTARLPSTKPRIRVPSSGFGSPLSAEPFFPPQNHAAHRLKGSGPTAGSHQNEPLDLSLPKPPSSDQDAACQTSNGKPAKEEPAETEIQHMRRRSSPGDPQALFHRGHLATGTPPAVFGYNGFPALGPVAQAALGLRGHGGGVAAVPPGRPPHSPEFLPPMAYVMEADTEAMLKKMHQDRHALVSEALSRGALDYRSLGDEGPDGEGGGGPGRKRLRKTQEGLYACDICQKTFQKSSSLLRHKYEHTGKRPHECQICSKAFKHKHHLIEHSRLHSGEKPYQCDKCGKRFSHSGSYSQHMNHRYAYCSRDQEPDQDHDQDHDQDPDMPLTPGTGSDFGARLAGETPPSLGDAQTPHSFLSDSSLDGGHVGPLSREAEEEEEEEEEEDHYDIIVERMSDSRAEEARKTVREEGGEEDEARESWAVQDHQTPGGVPRGPQRAELRPWADKTGECNGAVEDKLGLDAAES